MTMSMDDNYRRYQIPAFGSCRDCYSDSFPFTQCLETSRPAGFLRYRYPDDPNLYVSGDLYAHDVVTPAMIVIPRREKSKAVSNRADDVKEKDHCGWVLKDSPSLDFVRKPPPKAVDDDLYKISPDLLLSVTTNKKKRSRLSFLACCVLPQCAV